MNFVLKMDFDSIQPEFQYFAIYPHHFWLVACGVWSKRRQTKTATGPK